MHRGAGRSKRVADDDALEAAGGEALVISIFVACASSLLALLVYAAYRDRYGRKEPAPAVVYVPDTDDPALVEALALSLVTADAEGLAFALRDSEAAADEEKVELAEKGVLYADDGGGVAEEKIELADL